MWPNSACWYIRTAIRTESCPRRVWIIHFPLSKYSHVWLCMFLYLFYVFSFNMPVCTECGKSLKDAKALKTGILETFKSVETNGFVYAAACHLHCFPQVEPCLSSLFNQASSKISVTKRNNFLRSSGEFRCTIFGCRVTDNVLSGVKRWPCLADIVRSLQASADQVIDTVEHGLHGINGINVPCLMLVLQFLQCVHFFLVFSSRICSIAFFRWLVLLPAVSTVSDPS